MRPDCGELCIQILEALGIDSTNVTAVTIKFRVDKRPKVILRKLVKDVSNQQRNLGSEVQRYTVRRADADTH